MIDSKGDCHVKITKHKLKQIIKEELHKVLKEANMTPEQYRMRMASKSGYDPVLLARNQSHACRPGAGEGDEWQPGNTWNHPSKMDKRGLKRMPCGEETDGDRKMLAALKKMDVKASKSMKSGGAEAAMMSKSAKGTKGYLTPEIKAAISKETDKLHKMAEEALQKMRAEYGEKAVVKKDLRQRVANLLVKAYQGSTNQGSWDPTTGWENIPQERIMKRIRRLLNPAPNLSKMAKGPGGRATARRARKLVDW